ncbi:hypothetical protein F53441_5398 [Fusarium austroafricanum]|uniref:Uncharacterized protein n=1 Tax=Fusarium austroafricanum TaxID=2364996 RepID=A0A8H4KLX4_9HYPO|nr:hypothetical protein F53441_5398 [Fusarium austroafricanum]
MSNTTVTEEGKEALRASLQRHQTFQQDAQNVLAWTANLRGLVATLQNLIRAVGGQTHLGVDMLRFSAIISNQAGRMETILQQMRVTFTSINTYRTLVLLHNLLRVPVGEEIPNLEETWPVLGLVNTFDNLTSELNTLWLGSMAYEQQVEQYSQLARS